MFLLIGTQVFSQSYAIKYRSVISYSYKISYTSGSYSSYNNNYHSESYIANTLQARLDANRKWLSEEYGKLKYAEFINSYNKTLHSDWLRDYEDDIRNAPRHYDLSNNRTAESFVYEYIGKFFNISSIKAEIELLKSINGELYRIQMEDPNNYIYSKRYKAINETLKKLETCKASEIKNLSWQSTELQMGNSSSTTNNSQTNGEGYYYNSYSGNNSTSANTINYPSVRSTTAERTQIKSVYIGRDYTAVKITANNQRKGYYYQWLNINRNTYITVNGRQYTMTKAEGIKIAPDKTYYSYAGQDITFTLYFPPIPTSATSMDLIESADSPWKFYGIKIR